MNRSETSEVEEVKNLCLGSWTDTRNRESKASNTKMREMDKIISRWAVAGTVSTHLAPLLADASAELRLLAATRLLKCDKREAAVSVLLELASKDATLVAPMAAAVLRMNRISRAPAAT